MGYMRHHAIVVCGWLNAADKRRDPTYQGIAIEDAHAKAAEIFPWVSPISSPAMNGYRSFFIPPDGSKEGWSDSDLGDERRNSFVEWLRANNYSDGSPGIGWVEVQFDDDEGESEVTRHSDG